MSEDRCVFCGEIIPEGRQVCKRCEKPEGTKPAYILTIKEKGRKVKFMCISIEQVSGTIALVSRDFKKIVVKQNEGRK